MHLLFNDAPVAGIKQLFTVPIDGSASPLPLPFGWLAPEGMSVVHTGPGLSLFEVDVAGGRSRPLVRPFRRDVNPGSAYLSSLHFSPDGSQIVHTVGDGSLKELRSLPRLGASHPTLLAAPQTDPIFVLSTSANRVVYSGGNPVTVRSVPVDGSALPIVLAVGTPAAVSLDGLTLVVNGTLAGGSQSGLHAVPTDGLGTAVQLDGPAGSYQGIWVRNGFAVLHRDPSGGSQPKLYGVPLDGSAAAALYHD